MKTRTYYILTLLLLQICYFPLAGQRHVPYAGGVVVRPVELTAINDSLQIELQIEVSRQAVNARQSWAILPRLVSEDREEQMDLPYLLINGKVKEKLYRRRLSYGNEELLSDLPVQKVSIPKNTDRVISYTVQIPLEDWMSDAWLDIDQRLSSPAIKEQLFRLERIAQIYREPAPILPDTVLLAADTVVVVQEIERVEKSISGTAYLDFKVSATQIIPDYGRNREELGAINRMLEEVRTNAEMEITGISIKGYASPDGAWATNDRLARGRAYALKEYLKSRHGLPEDLFKVDHVPEDWEGLREMVEASSLYEKEEILRIIDRVGIFDGREAELMKLSGGDPYRRMLREMFPRLRRVEYEIHVLVQE